MGDDKKGQGTVKFWPDDPIENGLNLVCASDMEPEPINWLWKGYLARGKLHIFAGAAGTGKTTLALNLAATVSKGGKFPDGTTCDPSLVLVWSGEDSLKDTLLPRLIASNADLDNIHFIDDIVNGDERRAFDPAQDMSALWRALPKLDISNNGIGLLIVDPIVNAVAGDSHKNVEVRRALAPLVDFGQQLNCAILGISHFSKGTASRDPTERVTGSIAFGALPRIVLATAKINTKESSKRIFCRAKSNIGPDGDGFEYGIIEAELSKFKGVIASYAEFGKAVSGTASELLSEAGELDSSEDDCADFLTSLLKGNKLKAKDLLKITRDNGFNDRQVRTTAKKLNVQIKREGFGKGSAVYWSMADININSILSHTLPKN